MTDDLTQNYQLAYNNQLGFGSKPALIVVDVVQAYFDPKCELYADVENELAAMLRVIDAARRADTLVVYTRVVYHPSGLNGGTFFRKAKPLRNMVAGHPLGRWATGINPLDNELIVDKQYPSAFFGTSLAATLTAAGIDTTLIIGLTTSGCVRATCVDASSHGFIPIIVEEACGDRHESPHSANLFDMNAKYGDVVSERQTIDYLLARDKQHD